MHSKSRTHKPQSPLEAQLRQPVGGEALGEGTRSWLEPRFQHSFGDVRVHADAGADRLARGFDARAFTVGSDLYFRAGAYQPGTTMGDALLTHELQHTAQSLEGRADAPRRADGLRVSTPNNPLERETRGAGRAGAAGAPAGEIVVQRMPEFLAQEQAWEDSNRSPFAAFNEQINPALDGVTAKADEDIFGLAQQAEGTGLGGLANFGALVGSGAMHATSGMLGGAAHLVSGLGQMVNTPLSTLGGLGHMAETFLPQHLAMLPRAAHGLFDFATGDHSLASGMDAMDLAFNPMRQMQDQQRMATQMVGGLVNPIAEHAASGHYGEALGRGAFEAAMMLVGPKGAKGAGAAVKDGAALGKGALKEGAALGELELLFGEGAMMKQLEPLVGGAEMAEMRAIKSVENPAFGTATSVEKKLESLIPEAELADFEAMKTAETPTLNKTTGVETKLDSSVPEAELADFEAMKTREYTPIERREMAEIDKRTGVKDAAEEMALDPQMEQSAYQNLGAQERLSLAERIKNTFRKRFTADDLDTGLTSGPKDAKITDLQGGPKKNGRARYGSGEIGVNVSNSEKLQQSTGLANTTAHELEHFRQHHIVDNPHSAIDPAEALGYKANFSDYKKSAQGRQAYLDQPVEVGARQVGNSFQEFLEQQMFNNKVFANVKELLPDFMD